MVTNSSAPTGSQRRCGPLRPNPPVGAAGSAFDVTRLKNFRSCSISAQTRVVAGSMNPPNTSFVMGGAVRVASMVTATGCAAAAPTRLTAAAAVSTHPAQRPATSMIFMSAPRCATLRYLPSSSFAAFARKM